MSDRYRFGPFEVDAAEHSLSASGRPVALTRRAFDTLLYLVRNPGRLVTREELIAAVWGETIVEEGNLHWTISAVRKSLAEESGEPCIETVRGLGYRFTAPVEAVQASTGAALAPEVPAARSVRSRFWLSVALLVVLFSLLAWTVSGRRDLAGRSNPTGFVPAAAAQQLYAEGQEHLQQRDALAAAKSLQEAVAIDPAYPEAWLGLAQAYELLGFAPRAEAAALKAVEGFNGLPERQRLAAEATYLRLSRREAKAADALRRLYELSHHRLEDGLELSETQLRAGQSAEALATLAELRREHPASREDARLALIETRILGFTEDYKSAVVAGERAVAAARRQGMVQVEAEALRSLAIARLRSATNASCGQALRDIGLARLKAEATGDRFLLATILQGLSNALDTCEKSSEAEQVLQEAIDLLREIGALGRLPPFLYNLGTFRLSEGNLLEADRLMREALDTCQAHGSLCRERFLHPLGVNRLHRGELAEARRMIDEGIQLNRQLGNSNRVAEAQSFLPDLAGWSGDLAQAIELQRQVLASREEIGILGGIAWAQSDLGLWLAEAGRGAEAVEHAREAVSMAAEQKETSLDAYSHASLALAHFAAADLGAADRESARALALLYPPRDPFASFLIWRVRAKVLLARGQLDAAEALIDQGLEMARRSGFVTYELEGRLLRVQLELARGRSAVARQLATDLAAEARAKGFGLIAQRCATAIAETGGP